MTKQIAQRILNAQTDFVSSIVEQFGKSKIESEKVLSVFIKHKIVKLDPIMGRYLLKYGQFWDITVINNAINQ